MRLLLLKRRLLLALRALFANAMSPLRWRQSRKLFEWSRLTFTPVNLHNYFLMATAQLYLQARLALGISITHAEITRK